MYCRFGRYMNRGWGCVSTSQPHTPVIKIRKLIPLHQPPLGGHRGITNDVATIPFHPSLPSGSLQTPCLSNPLMLPFHLFFCRPLLLVPFTLPCKSVFAMPKDLEMWPYHLSFRFFTMVRRSSCTPIAFWILSRTSSFVTWSL